MSDISLKGMVSIPFLKKLPFTGSHGMMKYKLEMIKEKIEEPEGKQEEDDSDNSSEEKKEEFRELIKATVFPGPFCFDVTPDEKKQSDVFEFSESGLDEAVAWLNKKYKECEIT